MILDAINSAFKYLYHTDLPHRNEYTNTREPCTQCGQLGPQCSVFAMAIAWLASYNLLRVFPAAAFSRFRYHITNDILTKTPPIYKLARCHNDFPDEWAWQVVNVCFCYRWQSRYTFLCSVHLQDARNCFIHKVGTVD